MKIESGTGRIRRQLFSAGSKQQAGSVSAYDPTACLPSVEEMTEDLTQVLNRVSPLPVGSQAVSLPLPHADAETFWRRDRIRRGPHRPAFLRFGFKTERWPVRVRFKMQPPVHSKAGKGSW